MTCANGCFAAKALPGTAPRRAVAATATPMSFLMGLHPRPSCVATQNTGASGARAISGVVQSLRAPGELLQVVAAGSRYGWVWSGDRIVLGAPDEPFGPPHGGTEQCQLFPPVDAAGDLIEPG